MEILWKFRLITLIVGCVFGFLGTLHAQPQVYALKASRLFDSASGTVTQPGLVIVSGGKIQTTGGTTIPAGTTVIELGDATLLPGFIDAHTHLTGDFDSDYNSAQLVDLQRN